MRLLAIPIILFSIALTIPEIDAACTTTKFGNNVFTNCSDGRSGVSSTFSGNTVHNFNDGSASVTNSFGTTSVSSSTQPSLGGISVSINEDTGISQWNDGVTGVHQNFGNVQVDSYSDGTICTTAPVGMTSFTNCPGDSKDAAKRSTIIGTGAGATDQ